MLVMMLLFAVTCSSLAALLISWELLRRRRQAVGHGRLRARLVDGSGVGEAQDRASGRSVVCAEKLALPGDASAGCGIFARLGARLGVRFRSRRARALRQRSYERELPALLEVIALGMRAGMGFDQAFELYACRFDTALARVCREPLDVWQRGLTLREVGLRELAQQVDSPFFGRFVSTALRSLRYGAPMTGMLSELAQEARKDYRAQREVMVAKAPVKMLLPTGVLILPAMLLLVMGPIVLDLMGRLG